jgi:hypothetical protein
MYQSFSHGDFIMVILASKLIKIHGNCHTNQALIAKQMITHQ